MTVVLILMIILHLLDYAYDGPKEIRAAPPVAMEITTAAGVPVRVIQVDLANPRVHVAVQLSTGFPNRWESFDRMIARSSPTAAVNGAYFDMRTLRPIGDIVIGGRLIHSGRMGTVLAITRDNRAVIRRVTWGRAEDWSQYETVLGCGPALVLNGRVDVRVKEEKFRDPHIMGQVKRMAIGLTDDRKLLIVQILKPVSFLEAANVMREMGCVDAMNLDAGASQAMYYRGHVAVPAGRPLTNLLCVYEGDPPRADVLVPTSAASVAPDPSLSHPVSLPGVAMSQAKGRSLRFVTICCDSGSRATLWCEVTVPRGFERSRVPRPTCRVHREKR